jgi:hypothetical protein
MCDFYSPQTLYEMSGIGGTQDAQYAEQAIMLLKSEPSRGFRIEVAADSLVEMDEATEKQNRLEFLTSVGTFMERVLPVAQQVPELAPLMGEMLMFGVRAFKGGRSMEAAFDSALAKLNEPKPPAEPQPDPEQMKMQAMTQVEQTKAQIEQAKLQTQGQIEQAKLQASLQIEQFKAGQAQNLEIMRQQAETERAEMKARIDAETKITIAQMTAQASEKPAVSVQIEGENHLQKVGDEVKMMADQAANILSDQQNNMAQAVAMLADAVTKMNKPKRKIVERGQDGRAIGVIEIETD